MNSNTPQAVTQHKHQRSKNLKMEQEEEAWAGWIAGKTFSWLPAVQCYYLQLSKIDPSESYLHLLSKNSLNFFIFPNFHADIYCPVKLFVYGPASN